MRGVPTARWVMATVVAGIALRCAAYAVNRSLWLDELYLWGELGPATPWLEHALRFLQPLNTQIAAPGFVLLTQAQRALLGDAEWALRLAPLLFGAASVPLAARLFSRVLQPVTGLFAVALVAFSTLAIYYSADFKPYSADLLFALLVLDLAVPRLDAPAPRIDLRLWAAGVLAVFMSLPSIMVLAGVGAAFVAGDMKRLGARRALTNVALAGSWAALFGGQVALLMSRTQGQPWLHEYWVGLQAFPPDGGGVVGLVSWSVGALVRALGTPLGIGGRWATVTVSTGVAALFAGWGAVALARAKGRRAVLFLTPVALALLAAQLGRYPFQGRVICFLIPSLAVCVALGVEQLAARFPSRRWLPAVCGALLVVETLAVALWHLKAPFYREESRPVLTWAKAVSGPGDTFYVARDATHAWRYYAPRLGLTGVEVLEAVDDERQPQRVADDMLARLAPRARVFFFETHYYQGDDPRGPLLAALAARGVRVVRSTEDVSATVLELDFSAVAR